MPRGVRAYKVRLFKQLYQHPLARDPRIDIPWQQHRGSIRWQSQLTGNPEVTLSWNRIVNLLSEHARIRVEPRAPTGLCMNTLFTLLLIGQKENPILLKSLNWLALRVVGGGVPFYARAIHDALRLWQQLGVTWPDLTLPPPISQIIRNERSLELTLNEEWLEECRNSRVRLIQLPLPVQGTPQNMVLTTWLEGSKDNMSINPYFGKVSGNKKCSKSVPHIPLESWFVVKNWYARNGGHIDWQRHPYIMGVPSSMINIQVWRP